MVRIKLAYGADYLLMVQTRLAMVLTIYLWWSLATYGANWTCLWVNCLLTVKIGLAYGVD